MKKRFLGLLMCLCMVVTMVPATAFAAANNINVTNVNYYDDSGDVESLKIKFGWNTASATSRLTVMTKKLRSAGESGTDKYYGDFTDYGYYGKSFKNWNEVLKNSSKFGMIYYADEQKMNMGQTNTITVNFDEGDIPLDKNQTYYLYLWTYYGGYYYPDNLFMVLKVNNGKFQFAPATSRNGYDSFTTLWEQTKAPASTSNNKPATSNNTAANTSKPAATTPSKTSAIKVTVEGKEVAWTDAVPFIKDGRTLVPLRPIANAMDLEVNWYSSLNQAYFNDGQNTVVFELGKKEYRYYNTKGVDTKKSMDAAAISVDGRTYAPAKYLAEAFGYNVGWNGSTSTVIITKGKIETPAASTPAPSAPAASTMKLDPLPPMDYTKQPDWYGKLTPAHTMSNARLVAEFERIDAEVDDRLERDIYMSDGPYSRRLDLWSVLSQRCEIVEDYDRGMKYGYLADYIVKEYKDLVAKYGDATPLRNCSLY